MPRPALIAALLAVCIPVVAAGQTPAIAGTAHPATTAHANAARGTNDAVRIEACGVATHAFLAQLAKGDYRAATGNFDAELKAALKPDQLGQLWQSVHSKFGKLVSQGAPQNLLYQGFAVVTVPLHFEKGALGARLACGADGTFAGFHIVPVASTVPPASH